MSKQHPEREVEPVVLLIMKTLRVEWEIALSLKDWLRGAIQKLHNEVLAKKVVLEAIGIFPGDTAEDISEKIVVYVLMARRLEIEKTCAIAREVYRIGATDG